MVDFIMKIKQITLGVMLFLSCVIASANAAALLPLRPAMAPSVAELTGKDCVAKAKAFYWKLSAYENALNQYDRQNSNPYDPEIERVRSYESAFDLIASLSNDTETNCTDGQCSTTKALSCNIIYHNDWNPVMSDAIKNYIGTLIRDYNEYTKDFEYKQNVRCNYISGHENQAQCIYFSY